MKLREDIEISFIDQFRSDSGRYILSDLKRGWHIDVVEVHPKSGGLNVYVTGDVPMPRENVEKATMGLKRIEGCVILDIHKHANNTEQDIHPICFFTSRDAAKDKIEALHDWANRYGFKPEKQKFWRQHAEWEKVIK